MIDSYKLDEAELDNFLVQQKNQILALINAYKLVEAEAALYVLSLLWERCGYGYKVKELRLRLDVARSAE